MILTRLQRLMCMFIDILCNSVYDSVMNVRVREA